MTDKIKWVKPQDEKDEDRRKPLKDLLPLVGLIRVVGVALGILAIAAVVVDLAVFKDDGYGTENARAMQRDSATIALPTKLQGFSDEVRRLKSETSGICLDQKAMAAQEAAIMRILKVTSSERNTRACPPP